METNTNNLVERDPKTNAIIPVLQAYADGLEKLEVVSNYLYVRGEKDTFIPVVKVLSGGDTASDQKQAFRAESSELFGYSVSNFVNLIKASYDVLVSDAAMLVTDKTTLANAYTSYKTKADALIVAVNNATTTGKTSDAELDALMITASDYSTAISSYKKTEETIRQNLTKTRIDNATIASRNLIPASATLTVQNVAAQGLNKTITINMMQGKTYTLSYESTTLTVANSYPQFYIWVLNDWASLQSLGTVAAKTRSFVWDKPTGAYTFTVYNHNYPQGGTITKLKLERGSTATSWTPAPEDF